MSDALRFAEVAFWGTLALAGMFGAIAHAAMLIGDIREHLRARREGGKP